MEMSHGRNSHEQEGLLTTQQANQKLGLSASQMARLRATRRIGYFQRGGRIYYAPEEVERVLKAFEVPALRPVVEAGAEECEKG